MDRAARDMRGVLADLRICEIAASEIRGCSLSEALRRLDKEEDRMVEEKWKPIMAERRRKAETEAEGHDVEGHVVGSSKGAGEEEGPEEPEEPEGPTGSSPHVVEGRRCALPITYVGNERPENTGKRKRCDLDQSQEPARPTTYVQQRSRSTLIRTIITSEKMDPFSSVLIEDQLPASTSAPFAEVFNSQGEALPHVPVVPKGVRHPPRVKGSSTSSDAKKATPADTNGRKAPLNMGLEASPAPSALPAVQQSRPLKFAPKPTSRLCNRRLRVDNEVPIVEQERQ